MCTAYDELQDIVDVNDIIKITLDEIELEKEATFELMDAIEIDEMLDDIVFWTNDSRIDKAVDYGCYEDDDEQLCFKEKKLKQKTKIKVMPKSLTQLWKDPETGMNLPLKTKAYLDEEKKRAETLQKAIEENNKRNYERAKNLIEKQLEEVEQFKFEPFTIIEGGYYNRCRYITLPENYPIPDNDYCLYKSQFYKSMINARNYVDFIGVAGMKNGKAQILFKYALDSLKNAKDLDDLVTKAIKENKFTLVLGISQESIDRKILDDVIQEIKEELEEAQN